MNLAPAISAGWREARSFIHPIAVSERPFVSLAATDTAQSVSMTGKKRRSSTLPTQYEQARPERLHEQNREARRKEKPSRALRRTGKGNAEAIFESSPKGWLCSQT